MYMLLAKKIILGLLATALQDKVKSYIIYIWCSVFLLRALLYVYYCKSVFVCCTHDTLVLNLKRDSLSLSLVLIIPLVDRDEAKVISLILVSSVYSFRHNSAVIGLSRLFSTEPMNPEFRRMDVRVFLRVEICYSSLFLTSCLTLRLYRRH